MQAIVQLFFNPASGGYDPEKIGALALALEAEGARVIETPSHNGPPGIMDDATHACIAGGDGTVRHVGMAMVASGRHLPVAIWPMGTVNLLAREGDLQRTASRLARDLLGTGQDRAHCPVRLNDTMYFACASAGPDSRAVADVSLALKHWIGRLAYAVSLLRQLAAWPRSRIRLVANGNEYSCEAVYVAKGRYFAGPWSFAPHASPGDGLLHVVALKMARRRDFVHLVLDLAMRRDPARRDGVHAFSCTQLELACDQPVPVQADGDWVASLPVKMEIAGPRLLIR